MKRRCYCGRPVAKDIADSVYCGEHDYPPPIRVRRFMDAELYDPSPVPLSQRYQPIRRTA